MRLPVTVAALLLAACSKSLPVKQEPFPAACEPRCFEGCQTDWPVWAPLDPESPTAWDDRTLQVDIPAKAQLDLCEINRRACAACLQRLDKAGVIRLR